MEYHNKMLELDNGNLNDFHRIKKLRAELQQNYGVTELISTNILNGFNIDDYVRIYARSGIRDDINHEERYEWLAQLEREAKANDLKKIYDELNRR